jgi:hypothetical protein
MTKDQARVTPTFKHVVQDVMDLEHHLSRHLKINTLYRKQKSKISSQFKVQVIARTNEFNIVLRTVV